jgi:hypothetical protein
MLDKRMHLILKCCQRNKKNKKNYYQVSFETGSLEMFFANQLVLITGEAFFYAEVGQPSQVELLIFFYVFPDV